MFSLDLALGSPLLALVVLVVISFVAGAFGAVLGVGGGVFIVPSLVVLFGLDIHLAIAASLVSVVATSTGSASTYVEEGRTDLKLGMFLEVATAVGSLVGALVAVTILAHRSDVLDFAFIPALLISALLMARHHGIDVSSEGPEDPLARRLGLRGWYVDPTTGQRVDYTVTRTKLGLALSAVAGVASGLLGIGGGVFKVPAMNALMNVPIRVATATSTFMIGVTAAAGAVVYLYAGDVSLAIAAPVSLAVLAGSVLGIRRGAGSSSRSLKLAFVGVIVLAAVLLLLRGIGVIG